VWGWGVGGTRGVPVVATVEAGPTLGFGGDYQATIFGGAALLAMGTEPGRGYVSKRGLVD